MNVRKKSFAICGGAYGDEGKGRIVDMLVFDLAKKSPVVVYRDNGGANAGHTVEFANGERIAFHQLPSGVFVKGAVVVLGKEMVLHPGDLIDELNHITTVKATTDRAKIKIDELAILALDTHRAYETVLKTWQSGSKGSTGRGISPAYADVLLRHPLRMRDIATFDKEKIAKHYDMYEALIAGLGQKLASIEVARLNGKPEAVGTKATFIKRLMAQAEKLAPITSDVHPWLAKNWADKKWGFVFEKAQAVGLDLRWGVYPDVTASDTTFDGIFSATEGIVDPDQLQVKAGVIKATYMSSVGSRVLPTLMDEPLANQIRQDANEYGATTKRPRDIAYLDLPALRFFVKVGRISELMLTHMDICYPNVPVKICTGYKLGSKLVSYRPDQVFLSTVKPVYTEMDGWDVAKLSKAKKPADMPKEARAFIKFMAKEIGVPITLITTGPKRKQSLRLA
ncbi:adenylosuccinate synthetase [Candidatus Woesebacteria bacterium]|nr:adenylosuccinate synthetase [Candidatus Woesebacteria bacterium]